MTNYTEHQAELAVYKAYVEATGETNEREIEHLRNCIRESIKTDVTPMQRKYLTHYLAGYSVLEIAEKYSVDKSTVWRTVSRAMDNLFTHIRYATPGTLQVSSRVCKSLTRLYKGGIV